MAKVAQLTLFTARFASHPRPRKTIMTTSSTSYIGSPQSDKQAQSSTLLTDTLIVRKLRSGELNIVDPEGKPVVDSNTGLEREPGQLEAHGYALRVGDVYSWRVGDWVNLQQKGQYALRPGEFVIARTYESLTLGKRIAATLHSLARLTLLGFSHISTTVHPGWGDVAPAPFWIALHNAGKATLPIQYKQPFCRVIFYEAAEEATREAPTLQRVTEMCTSAIAKQKEALSRKRSAIGWVLVIIFVALGSGAIYYTGVHYPQWSPAVIAMVAAMLPVMFMAIHQRFHLL